MPEAATQKHLEILSEIAELLSDAGLREQIKSSTDAAGAARPDRRLAIDPGRLSAMAARARLLLSCADLPVSHPSCRAVPSAACLNA